jgi:hypothetical protein
MTSATTDSVLSPRTRWTIVGLLSASITINLLDRQVLSVLASELRTQFQWSNAQYAYIAVAFNLGLPAQGHLDDCVRAQGAGTPRRAARQRLSNRRVSDVPRRPDGPLPVARGLGRTGWRAQRRCGARRHDRHSGGSDCEESRQSMRAKVGTFRELQRIFPPAVPECRRYFTTPCSRRIPKL